MLLGALVTPQARPLPLFVLFSPSPKIEGCPKCMGTPAKREREVVQGTSEGTQGLDPSKPASQSGERVWVAR